MSYAQIGLRGAVFIVLMLIVIQLPIFPQVAEMRTYASEGETLSLVYSFGSLKDFIASYHFIRTAWTTPPKIIYAVLAVFNAAITLLICYFGIRLSDRILKKWTPLNRHPI